MRPSTVLVAVCFALPTLACSMLHKPGEGDAGVVDAAPPLVVLDAAVASAPLPVPANVNEVARFPDEAALSGVAAKVEDPHVAARNSVPGGALVATLAVGTPVVEVASHQNFILGSFPDPKTPSRILEGWIAREAFIAGPTPPPRAGCGAGLTMLVSEDQNFCGRTCKSDKECPSGQSCTGKANLYVAGKAGAETPTCTIPAPETPAVPPVTTIATIVGVQQPPLPNGTCAPRYVMASDRICHFECNVSPMQCPPRSRCTAKLTSPQMPVCEAAQ